MDSVESAIRKPFIEHIYELRRRALICVIATTLAGFAGYAINEKLLHIIQKPLGKTLFYTSPTGGFSFIFKICLLFGLIVALPIIIYQIIKFLSPLMKHTTKRFTFVSLLASAILAFAGITFAYLLSLPAALHFLSNFGGAEIQSLITADEYFNFALAYLAGFAILFQLPLLMLLINRIKPLSPGPLMRFQRYVILISFVVSAMLTPTPDPVNQALMAVPVVILYQLSIGLICLVNWRKNKRTKKSPSFTMPIRVPNSSAYSFKSQALPARVEKSPVTQTVPVRQRQYIDIMPASQTVTRLDRVTYRPAAINTPRPQILPPARRVIDMVTG